MGGACSAYGERCVQGCGGKIRGKKTTGDPSVDGRIILKRIFREWGMDWIKVAQDRDRWRALVNAVMNLRVP
jgi:hypothetical protein